MNASISRRNFLKIVGANVGALALGSLTGCSLNYERKQSNYIPRMPLSFSKDVLVIEPWKTILETASRTPSPHNTQPWKIKIHSEKRAEIFLDHERSLPDEDVTGCFITCAVGMFVESCRIAAANQNLEVTFHKNLALQNKWQLSSMGFLEITKKSVKKSIYQDELFLQRRTSRLELSPDLVSADILKILQRQVNSGKQQLVYISDQSLIQQILDLNLQALVEDINSHWYNREVVKWFRFTEEEARLHRDGLSASCMNLSSRDFRLFAHYPGLAEIPLIGPLVINKYRTTLGGASQMAILCGDFFNHSVAFDTGRMFMRLWLDLAKHGLYLHPFGNLVTNLEARAKLVELTGAKNPWIVFRFGYSAVPPESYRLEVSNLCV